MLAQTRDGRINRMIRIYQDSPNSIIQSTQCNEAKKTSCSPKSLTPATDTQIHTSLISGSGRIRLDETIACWSFYAVLALYIPASSVQRLSMTMGKRVKVILNRYAYQRCLASNYGGCAACAYRFPAAGTPDDTLWNERKVLCG